MQVIDYRLSALSQQPCFHDHKEMGLEYVDQISCFSYEVVPTCSSTIPCQNLHLMDCMWVWVVHRLHVFPQCLTSSCECKRILILDAGICWGYREHSNPVLELPPYDQNIPLMAYRHVNSVGC